MAELGVPDVRSSIEQIVRELADDFDGMPVDEIHALVNGCFQRLAREARVKTYLPVLIKRAVREELRARTTSAA